MAARIPAIRIATVIIVAIATTLALAAPAVAADEPTTQSSPDEAFVDPAVDLDRAAGTLAYGANAVPADGGASAEVAVRGAADAPAATGGGTAAPTGDLPYTGLTVAGMAVIAICFLLAGIGAILHARRLRFQETVRESRRRELAESRARRAAA